MDMSKYNKRRKVLKKSDKSKTSSYLDRAKKQMTPEQRKKIQDAKRAGRAIHFTADEKGFKIGTKATTVRRSPKTITVRRLPKTITVRRLPKAERLKALAEAKKKKKTGEKKSDIYRGTKALRAAVAKLKK